MGGEQYASDFPYTYAKVRVVTATATRVRRGRPARIDRDEIIDAAVALAETDGLGAVTIRAVARRLGVAPMTLYGHVAGADELVDLVVGATITATLAARPEVPERRSDARAVLIDFAEGLRSMLLTHPAVLDAYRRRPVQHPTALSITDHVFAALLADGVDDEVAVQTYAAVDAFVVGFVSLESRSTPIDSEALEDHPTLRRLAMPLGDLFADAAFDRGLAAIIDAALPEGSEAQPTSRRRRSPSATNSSTP